MTNAIKFRAASAIETLNTAQRAINPTYGQAAMTQAVLVIRELLGHVESLEKSEAELVARIQTMVPRPKK